MRLPVDPEDAQRLRDVLGTLGITFTETDASQEEASVLVPHEAEVHPAKSITTEGDQWRVHDPRISVFIIDMDAGEVAALAEPVDSTIAKFIRTGSA